MKKLQPVLGRVDNPFTHLDKGALLHTLFLKKRLEEFLGIKKDLSAICKQIGQKCFYET